MDDATLHHGPRDGDWLRAVRLGLGVTLVQAAEASGLSAVEWGRRERGLAEFDRTQALEHLVRAQALGRGPDPLLEAAPAKYVRDRDGIHWRLFGSRTIAHDGLLLYERVGPWSAEVTSCSSPVDGEEISRAEWTEFLAHTIKYQIDAEAKAERGREASKYGITCGKVVIVRCTRTRWVDSLGGHWLRNSNRDKDGRRVKQGYSLERLSDESLAALHAVAKGRDRVDFVAERKAAAQPPTRELLPLWDRAEPE